jgi:pimeloyl-ACP methyl ester carboxylesterase
MSRSLDIGGYAVTLAEIGAGEPLLYLHGFADIHASTPDWLPFHRTLADGMKVIAPAHPGCAGSGEIEDIDTIDDLVFHYQQVIDALRLGQFHLAGASIGGWVAAELAVRIPERVRSLSLIGACGLFIEREPITDIFMMVQASDGGRYHDYRRTLFRSADAPEALDMFPDGMMPAERELLRYRTFRFASRVGFTPPYLHNRKLRGRLGRFTGPSLVIAGQQDNLVPAAHAKAYADGLRNAELRIVAGAGNSLVVEKPGEVAALVRNCVQRAGVISAVA